MKPVGMDAGEYALWVSYRSQPTSDVRNRIVERYMHWLERIADGCSQMTGGIVEPEEAVSDGFFGLASAIERFDPHKGIKFTTFAMKRIVGAIKDGMRSRDWVPREVRRHERDGETEVTQMGPLPEGEFERDILECRRDSEWERRAESDDWFNEMCRGLSAREVLIVALYFRENMTLKGIGAQIGVSESRCSQLLTQILGHLRQRSAVSDEIRRVIPQSRRSARVVQ